MDATARAKAVFPAKEHLDFVNTVPEWVELAINQGDFLEIAGNLLENACNFATSAISIECAVHDGWASITINDDGPGVAEARITHMTKRGVQLDTADAGSGLGLAIAKDIIEAHTGQIRLENRTGKGLRRGDPTGGAVVIRLHQGHRDVSRRPLILPGRDAFPL
ncbi:ATP-binding protein [Roseovarius sp. S1116L3]|uniref:ATP-binding protein n=1 Tax=Roseovarius roseus TaxID=3342636 RepID=UPI00372686E0